MRKFFMREEPAKLQEARKALLEDGQVEIINEYETFYGVSFDRWLRKGLEDLDCTIEVTSWNKWENYPWSYRITLNKQS